MPERICLILPARPESGRRLAALAARLAEGGAEVTLLATGHEGALAGAAAAAGAPLLRLADYPARPYALALPPYLQIGLRLHDLLRTLSFDTVIFPSLGALAFYRLQARTTLGEGRGVRYLLALDGATQKRLEEAGAWNSRGLNGLELMWRERYCVERCDALLPLDDGTLAWLRDKGWKTPPVMAPEALLLPREALAAGGGGGPRVAPPRISICVAHYNHGPYLKAALQSLADQDYPDLEVVVCDDGSTEAASREAFDRCAAAFDSRFLFFRHANQGPSVTRNACAERAGGQYLMFFDADNLALPEMARVFFAALEESGADVVTSHFKVFREGTDMRALKAAYLCAPAGPDLASCLFGNTMGDVVCLIRKELFWRIGGFAATRHGCEDWELFVRLALAGYRQEVIPEALYWYRHTETGMRGTMDVCRSHRLVLGTYARHLPGFAAEAIGHFAAPQFYGEFLPSEVIVRTMMRLGYALEKWYQRLFPVGSRRQRAASFCWNAAAGRPGRGGGDDE